MPDPPAALRLIDPDRFKEINDQQTADILTAPGFDLLPGYHFGRPVPPDRLGVDVPA
jgi:EAL domain-containing protein (putative c-di-GMP-specific phosphodiesterase class I)